MWQQHELWDGTYTFDDWCDAVEMIQVKAENNQRLQDTLNEKRG